MSDKTILPTKSVQQPSDEKHTHQSVPSHDEPIEAPAGKMDEIVPDQPTPAMQEHERNERAEQQLKQQQHERSAFQPGNTQTHQQGNRQR